MWEDEVLMVSDKAYARAAELVRQARNSEEGTVTVTIGDKTVEVVETDMTAAVAEKIEAATGNNQ